MAPVLLLYGSLTFNTKDAATALHASLATRFPDREFVLEDVHDITPEHILQYNTIIFGSSTWDDGNNADTEEFIEAVKAVSPDYSRRAFALFGLGDSSYPEFCASVYIVQKALVAHGALVYEPHFKIDGYPTDDIIADLTAWAVQFLQQHG